MIWLALLAQITAPAPENLRQWFYPDDLPRGEITLDPLNVVTYSVAVAPDGTAYDCRIEASSGVTRLDSHTCSTVLRSTGFRPATDGAGNATYGVYRTQAFWWVGDGDPPAVASPDAEFDVNKLPAGTSSPALVELAFSVDANGRATTCVPAAGEKNTTLAAVACEQLAGNFTVTPARTANGSVTESVQNALVLFRTN